ncbi:MAG: sulfurtransferase [Terriglobales bacterium]
MKRTIHVSLALFLLLAAVTAFSQTAPGDMAVSTRWLADHGSDANLVVLHVGVERKTYDAGHIANARFLPMSSVITVRNGVPNQTPAPPEIKKALENVGVGDESHVVIYGDAPLLATHVYFLLDYIGHQHHAILDGGPDAWKAEKRPLAVAAPEFKPATLTVKAHPELLVDLAGMQKIVAEKKMMVLDSRPADQYSGTMPGEAIKRGGHIPDAKDVFWQKTLVSTSNPVLKSAADIRALYETAGLKPGAEVVTYCRTGLMAKHTYFTLKMTGFRPVVYDGSFMEWNNTAGTAVDKGEF